MPYYGMPVGTGTLSTTHSHSAESTMDRLASADVATPYQMNLRIRRGDDYL